MRTIPKLLAVVFLSAAVLFYAVPKVSALTFPECRWSEITATCNCPHAYDVCADNTCSQCLQYKNDPRYRYLWKDIYCRNGSVLELLSKYRYPLVVPLLTAMALELIVFAVRGYRERKALLSVALGDGLSFIAGLFLFNHTALNRVFQSLNPITLLRIPDTQFSLYGMNSSRIFSLLVIGAVMTVVEIVFLIYAAKFTDRKKAIATAVLANAVSLVLGLGMLNAVYPHFSAPRIF